MCTRLVPAIVVIMGVSIGAAQLYNVTGQGRRVLQLKMAGAKHLREFRLAEVERRATDEPIKKEIRDSYATLREQTERERDAIAYALGWRPASLTSSEFLRLTIAKDELDREFRAAWSSATQCLTDRETGVDGYGMSLEELAAWSEAKRAAGVCGKCCYSPPGD